MSASQADAKGRSSDRAKRAEVGSPAQGLLFEHDVITGVNDKPLPKDHDPRYAMALKTGKEIDAKSLR